MIYTVGHKANYLKAIAESEEGRIYKVGRTDDLDGQPYPGGCAFKSLEDAQRMLKENGHTSDWAIWGIDADWENDTAPNQGGGWWHDLLRDAWIIPLNK